MKLDDIMKENWKKVREKFYYPDLPMPKLVSSDRFKTAAIDMIEHQIIVNKDFVEEFNKKGLDYNTIFTGLLAHEVNHYITCPFDLTRSLLIDLWAKKVDENIAKTATAVYIDIIDNLDLIMRKDVKEVGELLKAQGAENPLSKVILAYYQKASDYDMGFDTESELDDFMKIQLERLFTIDFFDTAKEKRNVTRFTRIVRDIMNQYNMKEQPDMFNLGRFDPEAYDKNEVNKSLKEIAEILEKGDFDKVVDENGLIELLGIKAGKEEGDNQFRKILYYQKLAENYPIGLKKRPLETNGALFPHSHKEFEIDDNPQDIDIYASLGKPFIPGLGKTWIKKQGTHYSEKKETPNVLIMRDISVSMQDCEPYAEVACVATANAYIDNGSAVATYLFNRTVDESELNKGYQTDKTKVHTALTKSNSGGTEINEESLKQLDNIIKKSEKNLDIVLVTDLEITGREELFKYLHDRQDAHRVTIIYTGKNGGIEELQKKYNDTNFAIYQIAKPEDIPNVIIGEVNKSI